MKTTSRVATLAISVFLPILSLALPAEGIFSYSGYLRTSSGAPETTLQSITFTLYDADTAGNVLWTQAVSVTPDSQGWFSAVLGGTGHALPPDQLDSQLWLGIRVGTEAEMLPRTKVGVAPHALTVDWGGVLNRPSTCATGQFVTGYDPATGAALCATPSGSGGGVSSVTGAGVISALPTTGAVTVSLSGCGSAGQILQWSGTAWQCIGLPAGGGGVSSVTATSPLISSGGATPNISIPVATASVGGYLAAADFASFAGKVAPPAAACGAGQVLTWNGSAATCVTDANTTYQPAPGSGISVTANVLGTDPAVLQRRVTATCAAGSSIRGVNSDGSVVCQPDANTAYSAGSGLTLAGSAFSADTSFLQRRVSSCAAGTLLYGVNADGSPLCRTPVFVIWTGPGFAATATSATQQGGPLPGQHSFCALAHFDLLQVQLDGGTHKYCLVEDAGGGFWNLWARGASGVTVTCTAMCFDLNLQ
jgi:hypothetical protein